MDLKALFKISYGLYVVGAQQDGKLNGCIVNTVMQITAEPVKCVVVVSKESLTHDYIMASKTFSVSVLGQSAPMETIAHFGFNSGKKINKFRSFPHTLDKNGNPVLAKDTVVGLTCKVFETVDAGTHTLFMAEVEDCWEIGQDEPLTYDYYRNHKKGTTPKNAPSYNPSAYADQAGKYRCKVCGYVYDGDTPFEELPDSYICPVCKKPKSFFERIEE
jgi:flavin reductase (DIM6/NTAB) family NADH-FMN oxidoreductase RutF/rubredoxin